MKKAIKILLIALLTIAGMTTTNAQTILKDIPIVSPENDPYTILIFAYNHETENREWMDLRKTNINNSYGWYTEGAITNVTPQYYVEYIRIVRGSKELNCTIVTEIEIHGGIEKEKIKDKPDLRKIVTLDGSKYIFGTPIPKP